MWGFYILAVLFSAVLLYAVGYPFMRAFGFSAFMSLLFAPVPSLFLMAVVGIVLKIAGITCPAISIFLVSFALSDLLLLASRVFGRKRGKDTEEAFVCKYIAQANYPIAALYVAVAATVVTVVFLLPLSGPESFGRFDDNTFHYSVIRGFLDSGTYSVLHSSAYLNMGATGAYYPAAWHIVTAIVASLFNCNVALASNAVLFVFVAIVLPLGVFLFAGICLEAHRGTLLSGALFSVLFGSFPWGFIVFGQLLPNMISFIFVLYAMVMLKMLFSTERLHSTISTIFFLLLSLGLFIFVQPNGLFTFGIWAALLLVNQIVSRRLFSTVAIRGAAIVLLLSVFVAAWIFFFKAPFMQGVVLQAWPAAFSISDATILSMLFMFSDREGIQPLLTLFVWAGVLHTFRNRRNLWLTAAYVIALLFSVVSLSYGGEAKQLFIGFWYNDPIRVGAMATLYAIPLAALGFFYVVEYGGRIVKRLIPDRVAEKKPLHVIAACLVSILIVASVMPLNMEKSEDLTVQTALPKVYEQVEWRYAWGWGLEKDEIDFIKRVQQVVEPDEVVINVPHDGSCWAYGICGLDTFFRRSRDVGAAAPEESEKLRLYLRDIETSEDVQNILRQYNAQYVLMLDTLDSLHPSTLGLWYNEDNWTGIEKITEGTPGFSLVLSEDDMRLYKIDPGITKS